MKVSPSEVSISNLDVFDESLAEASFSASEVLEMLQQYGSTATIAQSGGKYFGFVCGGNLPVALAAKWMTDTWDQQATGSYIQYSENRDGMLYTPEMSRRARSIELWATLKYLGRSGHS
jgi:hypothetical protein